MQDLYLVRCNESGRYEINLTHGIYRVLHVPNSPIMKSRFLFLLTSLSKRDVHDKKIFNILKIKRKEGHKSGKTYPFSITKYWMKKQGGV